MELFGKLLLLIARPEYTLIVYNLFKIKFSIIINLNDYLTE